MANHLLDAKFLYALVFSPYAVLESRAAEIQLRIFGISLAAGRLKMIKWVLAEQVIYRDLVIFKYFSRT